MTSHATGYPSRRFSFNGVWDIPQSVMLEDEHGNSYVANAIEPAIDPVEKKLFADWRGYKAAHAMLFERIDRQFLDEYTRMAEAGVG